MINFAKFRTLEKNKKKPTLEVFEFGEEGPPESDEEEWQDPATDGHAAAADAIKAMVATYLSEWGGDARADAVGADIGAMFDAREL